jgi:hypothetical protein
MKRNIWEIKELHEIWERKKGKGKKWKNEIMKMEMKIKRNGKIKGKGNECEHGKEQGKMTKCVKW